MEPWESNILSELFSGFLGSMITSIIIFLLSNHQDDKARKLQEEGETKRQQLNFYAEFYSARMNLRSDATNGQTEEWAKLANKIPAIFSTQADILSAYKKLVTSDSSAPDRNEYVIDLYEALYDNIKSEKSPKFDRHMLTTFLQ